MPGRTYIEELEFDLPSKLLQELVALFDEMDSGPLDVQSLQNVDEVQGVYQLFNDDELVYIGKTDSDAGLKKRLLRHSQKIKSRQNLNVSQVTFKAIRVYVFTAMDLEGLLIDHYKKLDKSPEWQNSGFGSNDPGRKRDTTEVKEKNFDAKYPIDLQVDVSIETESGNISVASLLQQMKKQLPYLIRFQNKEGGGRTPHNDLVDSQITIGDGQFTVIDLLRVVKQALGINWQITVLPGYVIIYKERNLTKYPSGRIVGHGL